MPGFNTSDIPDMSGKTVIVTGASSGIGLETAKALAAAGGRVILAVRDQAKGRKAAATMTGATEVRPLDLASLESVRAFARDWTSAPSAPDDRLDLLINNAGVMIPPLSRTADGFELQFGTNHLGHFALTNLLLPAITAHGRVVTLSSGAHYMGRIDFDDPGWERRRYRRWASYGQSKLANLLFTAELQRRLSEAGSTVIATAAHPGYAATNLQSHSGSRAWDFAMAGLGNRFFAQDAADGALPTLYAATAAIPGNSFAGPGGRFGMGGAKLVSRSARARDADAARRLWDLSERLTGVSFPALPNPSS
jgi:NAD(P)-dependent dehydrogenase (short-subunit alcohol dehydrogenase family)